MDGDGGLNMHNWGYYDPPMKHLNLNLMTNVVERKPILGGHDPPMVANSNGGFHQRDYGMPTYQVDFIRESWIHRDNKFFNMLPTNQSYGISPETAPTHPPMQMLQRPESSTEERMAQAEPASDENIKGHDKKRMVGKSENALKAKKPKKSHSGVKVRANGSVQRAKPVKKTAEVVIVINGIDMDISSIPIPVCSCTGMPQQCYRWGSGGWQSACCTTGMSLYPLPMSTKRRGARIAGRKMSLGAFKKVLEKLASEGYNFSNAIDLKAHWARHGTNKFVTIR